jgi:hypothetical protein
VAHAVTSGNRGKGRICVGTFWGRMYWARSKHGEIPTLALETYAENSKGAAVEDAREVGKSFFSEIS